jgi:hypothetical protein
MPRDMRDNFKLVSSSFVEVTEDTQISASDTLVIELFLTSLSTADFSL